MKKTELDIHDPKTLIHGKPCNNTEPELQTGEDIQDSDSCLPTLAPPWASCCGCWFAMGCCFLSASVFVNEVVVVNVEDAGSVPARLDTNVSSCLCVSLSEWSITCPHVQILVETSAESVVLHRL